MKTWTLDGQDYRLPNTLNEFQLGMYVHLIRWKWSHITKDVGYYKHKGRLIPYDAILPDRCGRNLTILYPPIREAVRLHRERFPFRIHKHFNHMASSQAANINLFLPVLRHPQVNTILRDLRRDFASLATDHLDNGCRIEFWDEPYGNLGDKTARSGTDADIAIAYRDHHGKLQLWLIEHKLTEDEFTECGGFKSPGRQRRHDCTKRFADLLSDPSSCYYHDVRNFNYWRITGTNEALFPGHGDHVVCPFRGGMNQLWRNQLLAASVEQDARQPFEAASFSVVTHSLNRHLDATLTAYKRLVPSEQSFSTFTSADVLAAAERVRDPELGAWITWYSGLYNVAMP